MAAGNDTIGEIGLLSGRKLALLCSRACPGSIIVRTLDMIRELRETSWTVISGFQSPIEQECLEILLRGERPVIVCPARSVQGMRIPATWKPAIAAGRMLITSPFDAKIRRATAETAEERNRFVVSLTDAVFIPHASPGGSLDRLCRDHIAGRKPILTLDDPANAHLTGMGARLFNANALFQFDEASNARRPRVESDPGTCCHPASSPGGDHDREQSQ